MWGFPCGKTGEPVGDWSGVPGDGDEQAKAGLPGDISRNHWGADHGRRPDILSTPAASTPRIGYPNGGNRRRDTRAERDGMA
jgi:hypothetical protein